MNNEIIDPYKSPVLIRYACEFCGREYSATKIGGVCFHCDEIVRGGLHYKRLNRTAEEQHRSW